MRLDKYLCDMQTGTRSQIREAVRKGLVTVNGAVVKAPDAKVDALHDAVCYMGDAVCYQKLYYYMLHKPAGCVTATRDGRDPTVMELLRDARGKELFPVGRLDKDTEGLLLVTNDGELAHDLLSPAKHVAKTYYVECAMDRAEELDADRIARLENGVDIGDETLTRPAKVRLLAQSEGVCRMELTITEGRFHQVKRMVQAVGGTVTYLRRLSMGTLVLDASLEKGCYRPLTEKELADLKKSTGRRGNAVAALR